MYAKVLYGILNNDAVYRAVVGVDDNDNINLYPRGEVNQTKTRPYAAYGLVSRSEDHNKDGRGIIQYNVDLHHYASKTVGSVSNAAEMDEAAINALDHFKGVVEGVKVKGIRVQGGGDGFDEGQESYHRSSEISIKVNP